VDEVVVFVEVPMGSRNKYEVGPRLGEIVLDRRVFTSMTYPADYGFIEGTMGGDGKDLEEAKVETFGYGNRADAERVVVEARARATT
jgi:inorganic pyrophosphatase